jgi:hypothetical protein
LKIKKIITLVLTTCLLINGVTASNIIAKAQTIGSDEIIYFDGQGYKTTFEDGNLTVKSLSSGEDSAYITLYADGTADAYISNDSVVENYELDIKELNNNDIDIDVYENNNEYNRNSQNNENVENNRVKVKEYNNLSELNYDSYTGQSVFGDFLVYSLSILLNILLSLIIAVVITSVTYYSVVAVIEQVKAIAEENTEMTYFYRAEINGPQVVIDLHHPILQTQAVSRIVSGLNVYTFFSTPAAIICAQVGGAGNVIGAEINSNRLPGYVYFYHYHVNRTNPAHSFFGFPYTA